MSRTVSDTFISETFLYRASKNSLGFQKMIELLEQTVLAFAGANAAISASLLVGGLTVNKLRGRKAHVDLPVFQDLPRGTY